MKRLITVLVAAAVALCIPLTAFAEEEPAEYTLHVKMYNAGADYGEYAKDSEVGSKDISLDESDFKDGKYELSVPTVDGWKCTSDAKTVSIEQSAFEAGEFTYELGYLKLVKYTVVCQDTDGKALDGGYSKEDVLGDTFTVNAPEVSGKTLDAKAKDITLTADEDKNILTFTYTDNASAAKTGTKTSGKDTSSGNSPQTGDPLALYGLVGAVSLIGGYAFSRKRR